MAGSEKRSSVIPSPKTIDVLGNSAAAFDQAVECWVALLTRSNADNSKTFSQSFEEGKGSRKLCHSLHDWALLALGLKEKRFDPEFADPGGLLATEVEDAHRLENAGDTCFLHSDDEYAQKEVDAAVGDLVRKLRNLDYAHAWAVIVSVQWFWEHSEEIDMEKDAWWTLPFRREWYQKRPLCSNVEPGKVDNLHEGNRIAERSLIQKALVSSNYNRSRAAIALGISRVTLYKKMKSYGLMDRTNQVQQGLTHE